MTTAGKTTQIGFIALLYLAGLCAAGQFAKIAVIFPMLREVYPDTGPALGFVVSIISIVGIVLGVFAGMLVARLGFRRMLLISLTVGALISLYQATLPPLPLMLASRVLEGFSHLGIVVAGPPLMLALSKDEHHPVVMTVWGTFFGVAFTLAAWFGTPFASAMGVPPIMVAHAAMMGTTAVIFFLLMPRQKLVVTRNENLTLGGIIARHRAIYTSPTIAAPALGFVFYALTYVATLTALPDYIALADRAMIAGLLPLISIAASLVGGATLMRRYSAVNVLIGSFAAGVIIAVLMLVFEGVYALYFALFVAFGLIQGASFAAIPALNAGNDERALATGAVAQMGNVGNTFGTPVLLALMTAGGYAAFPLYIVGIFICGALIHLYLAHKRRG